MPTGNFLFVNVEAIKDVKSYTVGLGIIVEDDEIITIESTNARYILQNTSGAQATIPFQFGVAVVDLDEFTNITKTNIETKKVITDD